LTFVSFKKASLISSASDQFPTLVVPPMVSKISFKCFAFSVLNHIEMTVSSHISFVAVGLAPADFNLLLTPGPSVALHFPT